MSAYTVAEVIRRTRTTVRGRDAIAVVAGDCRITYAELDERTTRLADALHAEGFQHGDRIGMLLGNRREWLETFFAVGKLGGVVVPLNHLLRTPELAEILADCDARWLVFEPVHATTVAQLAAGRRLIGTEPAAPGVLDIEGLIARGRPDPPGTLPSAAAADDLLLLQYTSGTTGVPKGVMHTHSTVLWNSMHQLVDYAVTGEDVWLVVPALCWAAGLHDLTLATLWAGGRIVLGPTTGFDPARMLRMIEDEDVTGALLVPTVLKRVLGEPAFDGERLKSLRLILSGGEPVPESSLAEMQRRLPDCDVRQAYGMSEFPTLMLCLAPADAARHPGSTGKACSAADIRVVDDQGLDADPGEIGEIICRSPANMLGYWNRPEATDATLVDGWLHTGDLARVDEDGFVYVCGRKKDMIITGGLNVYPAEVERAIAEYPSVIEAAVVGRPDPDWGEVGAATVVLRELGSVDETELRDYLQSRIATFKVPRAFVLTTEPLPRTTSGKVQKFRL